MLAYSANAATRGISLSPAPAHGSSWPAYAPSTSIASDASLASLCTLRGAVPTRPSRRLCVRRRGVRRGVNVGVRNKTQPNTTKQKHKQTQNKTQPNTTKHKQTQPNTTKTQPNTTKQNTTKQNTTKQNTTKQNKTQQNTTKQNTTKQNTTKLHGSRSRLWTEIHVPLRRQAGGSPCS